MSELPVVRGAVLTALLPQVFCERLAPDTETDMGILPVICCERNNCPYLATSIESTYPSFDS
jgi:hypothetical protein